MQLSARNAESNAEFKHLDTENLVVSHIQAYVRMRLVSSVGGDVCWTAISCGIVHMTDLPPLASKRPLVLLVASCKNAKVSTVLLLN